MTSSRQDLVPLGEERHRQRGVLDRKKRFSRGAFERLMGDVTDGRSSITWSQAASGADTAEDVLLVRHDVDHDLDAALDIARWESERGIHATYCILHSAWYYRLDQPTGPRSSDVVEACQEIQALGHEVSLHNNGLAVALSSRQSAADLVRDEVAFLRAHGIAVTGTSSHGDRLCRTLDFRNYEVFAGCVDAERGGPRDITHESWTTATGALDMREIGLEYEAYELPRDVYLTDSGGRPRAEHAVPARGRRAAGELPPLPYRTIVGMLLHPVWWDISGDVYGDGEGVGDGELFSGADLQQVEQSAVARRGEASTR